MDTECWRQHLPASIEAVYFTVDDGTARAVYRDMLQYYHKSALEQTVLVQLDLANMHEPFSLAT